MPRVKLSAQQSMPTANLPTRTELSRRRCADGGRRHSLCQWLDGLCRRLLAVGTLYLSRSDIVVWF
jgi:ribosomal protein S14